MDSCGNVRMDRYWNFVALPFFIITLLFGLYALFTVDEYQFASTSQVASSSTELRAAVSTATKPLTAPAK
jgi:hypothetical protein